MIYNQVEALLHLPMQEQKTDEQGMWKIIIIK